MERSTSFTATAVAAVATALFGGVTAGCSRAPTGGAPVPSDARPANAGAGGAHGAAAALTLTGDRGDGARADPAATTLSGTVVERLDVPNYTYLRLTAGTGERWAAVPTSSVAVGTTVTVVNGMLMTDFSSKTLGRTFDRILFGTLAGAGESPRGAPAASAATLPPSNPHAPGNGPVGATSVASPEVISVAKAAGAEGRTVSELYAQRRDLAGGTAAVRGRVVKVTRGVLGRTWLHLRDGTGSDATHDSDLVVSTSGEAQLGDELTARGTVRVDHDLGAGYVYALLLEDASLTRP